MNLLPLMANLFQALYLMGVGNAMRRVCYIANWAQYRPTVDRLTPDNIEKFVNPYLCSHIIIAFVDVRNGIMATREWNDDKLINALLGLKTLNPTLKVMVAVGGWNAGTKPFSHVMANRERMNRFNREAIRFLRHYELDGLDMDLEYPANRGSPPEDRERFVEWMTMLAEDFKKEAESTSKPKLILSSAVGVGKKVVDSGYLVPELNDAMDFITLMTYDFHGSWENKTGHNAPLRYYKGNESEQEQYQLTIEWAVDYWISKGADHSKLNLGIPTYGRSFSLCNPQSSSIEVGADACEPGHAGIFTLEPGVNSYYETCLKQQCVLPSGERLYETKRDSVSETPYLVSTSINDWVSTEDPESVAAKALTAIYYNLGGVAIWTIDFDDFSDLCGGGPQPLLHAINEAIDLAEIKHQLRLKHLRNKRLQMATSGRVDPCQGLVMPDEFD